MCPFIPKLVLPARSVVGRHDVVVVAGAVVKDETNVDMKRVEENSVSNDRRLPGVNREPNDGDDIQSQGLGRSSRSQV